VIENLIALIGGMAATALVLTLGGRAGRAAAEPEPQTVDDADLLAWAHCTRLSVIAASGTHFEMSLAELYASDHPSLRTWNLPVSIALYDPRDRETVDFHQYGTDAFYG